MKIYENFTKKLCWQQATLKIMITEKMASFTVQTSYSKLPKDVVEMAKLCFLDFLGVALRGSGTEGGRAVRKVLEYDGLSTVLGSGKTGPLDSSLANGIFAHSLDLDDGHRLAQLHPGCCVIPAALSLCESQKRSGKDFITALVVGYESTIAMGMLVNPAHRRQGFHSTGTCGTFGAAAAACKALGLGYDKTLNAIGLAGTQAAGLLESDHAGSMGKHLHAGRAAQSGVLSALLAKNGFTGAKSIVEGKEGFLNAMALGNDYKSEGIHGDDFKGYYGGKGCTDGHFNVKQHFDLEKYHILNIYFKKYPVCRHLHSSVDAAIGIKDEINLQGKDVKSEEIQKIIVKTYKIAAEHDNYDPRTVEDLRQSLPLSIAVALFEGDLNLNNVQIKGMGPEIKKISNKIFIERDEDLDALYPDMRPSDVSLIMNGGGTLHGTGHHSHIYHKRVNLPCGEPENPFKKEDILGKFHMLNPEFDVEVLKVIENLESYKMNEFMDTFNAELK